MQNYWFESLPESCPPADSEKCQGIYYRVAIGNPAQSEDFFSQKKLAPDKTFTGEGIDECIVRAVSVFSELTDAKRLLHIPADTRSAFPVISVQSPVSIQCCWQS